MRTVNAAAAAALLATLWASPAAAAVLSGTATTPGGGTVVLGQPVGAPGSDQINTPDVYAFDEVQSYALTVALTVTGPDGSDIVLPAGTLVDSHYVEWDPSFADRGWGSASVTFDGPVLGVLIATAALIATDAEFGTAAAGYGTNRYRGVEVPGDTVGFVGDTVSFNAYGRYPEGIRVFTLAAPTEPVPVPGAALFLLTGMAAFGARWARG